MTDPTQPATDEEVEQARRDATPQGILGALVARIDAERAARERAEANADVERAAREKNRNSICEVTDMLKYTRDKLDEATARAERAGAALRSVALRNGEDGPCFCSVVAGPHHLSCLNARAILSRKDGG